MSWEMVRLGDVCDTSSGGTPSSKNTNYYGGDIPWIKSGDLRENIINQVSSFITEEGLKNSSAKWVEPKAVLLAMYGATVGRLAILNIAATTNQAVCSIRPKEDNIAIEYIYYLLRSKVSIFLRQAVGGAQPNISQTIIKETVIPFPPLPEQQRIADILDKAEAINQKREQVLALCDEFLRATFLDMFGDPVSNPKGWDIYNWEKVIDIKNGKNQKKVAQENGEYAIFGSGGEMGRANDFITPAFSVIIGRKGNINDPILITEPVWNVDTAFGLVPNIEMLLHDYLYLFCVFFDFLRLNKTVTIPSLRKVDLYEIQIPIPPIELQQKFSEIVEKVNGIKTRIQQAQELPLFDALSQQAFKGELTQ